MQEQARVQELIETMEKASDVVAEKRRRHDVMYRSYLLAEGELSEARRAYVHARSQVEALAVAGLQKPVPARPASLDFLRDIGRAGHAGSPLMSVQVAPAAAPAPVPVPPMYPAAELTPAELATLRQAEAEDNAAYAAADNIEQALADNDPPAVQQEQALPLAVPSRVAAVVHAADDPERRVQNIVQALEAEQKAEAVPRIARSQKPWQSLGESFTRPVLAMLREANAPVPLATILTRVRSLYTAETAMQYLRDMVASGHVQKVGKGFYAHKDWRNVIVEGATKTRKPYTRQAKA